MLDRKTRLKLNEAFTIKNEVKKKIAWNAKEVENLKAALKVETNKENRKTLKISIRFGQGKISLQKTELLSMSNPKIAKNIGIDVNRVNYYDRTLFSGIPVL